MKNIGEEKFWELVCEDMALARQVVALFESEHKSLLDSIRKGIAAQDAVMIENASHRLKGSLQNFFAEKSTRVAEVIENSARVGDLNGLDERLKELENAIHGVLEDLKKFHDS